MLEPKDIWRQPNGSVLEARHPISATDDLTNRPGHDLGLEVKQHSRLKQCSPAGGSVIRIYRPGIKTCQRLADRFPLG
ncbi:hypothetical protein, partial [Mycobacterium bohemicum]|uniref:hypothetical protein n=1 Tax=Mycobacterium bohemicum TaxID=56425 RepID=UPI001B805E57